VVYNQHMKTVVITGISRGIGKALANKFLNEGYRVIGTSTSGKVDIRNENLEIIKLDLSNQKSIALATKKIASITTKIDILLNNAGTSFDEVDEEIDVSVLRKTLEVNLLGPIDFTKRLIQYISKGGQIINTSSIMASLTTDIGNNILDCPSYRISKTAVNMYTKTLASLLKKRGVIVSSIHPGWVKTAMGGEDAPREPKEAADQIFKLATTSHETGLFWYDNEKLPW